MKILLDTNELAFQNPGGGEVVIEKTCHHLRQKGVEVDLFNKWTHKLSDYDIIHQINTGDYKKWFYYQNIKAKFILTPTRWIPDSKLYQLKHNLSASIKKIVLPGVFGESEYNAMTVPDHFTPTTNQESEKLQSFFNLPANRFTTIYNGVEKPLNITGENLFIKKHKEDRYALFVGSISPNKNVDLIIRACKEIGISLFIIGSSRAADQIYFEKCQSIASDKTKFIGRIENTDPLLAHAFAGAQVLVNASEFETCSLVGLEAGSYGTPVVMTAIGGTHEVYKDLVEFCLPRSINSLKNAIELSLRKSGTDRRLEAFVNGHYTWDKIIDRLIEVYQKVLAS